MQNTISLEIGAPVYHDRRGYICHIAENTLRSFTLGTGTMRPVRHNLTIVWPDNMTLSEVPDTIAEPWLEAAARMNAEPILNAEELLAQAQAKSAERRAQQQAEADAARQERARYEAEIERRIPAWAKAVIIGELIEDCSDSMSDYWNGRTIRSVVLGFSRHTRDLFPEMRAAAANFPETADLVTAPESAEHREKYSMGGGYYLKAGSRYSNGWKVSKQTFYGDGSPARHIPSGEWFLSPPKAEPVAAATSGAMPGGMRIEEHVHTKKGFTMFLCIMADRVERAEFDRLRDHAQSMGGWYSRPWGKTPGGFAFKDRATAEAFAGLNGGPDGGPDGGDKAPAPTTEAIAPAPAPAPSPAIGDKLRELADAMAGEIAGKFADRRENTPKQQRQAAEARNEGRRLERTRDGLRALAALHDAGTVPPELARVRSRKAAYDLAQGKMHSRGGYYDAGVETGHPYSDIPAAVAFWALLRADHAEQRKAEELRQKIAGLKFARIPGYFPTPAPVLARMIEAARLSPGLDVLEPSAGSGAIADAVKAACPDARLHIFEIWNTLREILEGKGYTLAGRDFLDEMPEHQVDRVLMNPPFEGMADIDHVRAAHSCLRSGGRLVAIMSPGPFFRTDAKATDFRLWLAGKGGEFEKLPDGSFAESGTGVGAYLVTIDAA